MVRAATKPPATVDDQPPLDVDPFATHAGELGVTHAALVRSIEAARIRHIITAQDDAAVAAALAIAASLDQAISYGATLETIVKGTTALRAYLAALNLTPASRDEDAFVDHDASVEPDWIAGAGAVPDPPH